MTSWDPNHYEAFLEERRRPGLDLMARIEAEPHRVVDLGCGTGRLTAELARRWPEAAVLGLDRSPEMLAVAAPGPSYQVGDIEAWVPENPPDLIYANASLHWIPDHQRLFPHLAARLNTGGTLAVQMPLSWDQPSHQIMREVGSEFGVEVDDPPTREPGEYYSILAPVADRCEIWTSTYHHPLTGDNPVYAWVSATGMMRFLNRIEPAHHDAYRTACAARIERAYPPTPDGVTVFPFSRLFILATAP